MSAYSDKGPLASDVLVQLVLKVDEAVVARQSIKIIVRNVVSGVKGFQAICHYLSLVNLTFRRVAATQNGRI